MSGNIMTVFANKPSYSIGSYLINGSPVLFIHDKIADEISVGADAFARCYGFKEFADLAANDSFLDFVNERRRGGQRFEYREIEKQDGKIDKVIIL